MDPSSEGMAISCYFLMPVFFPPCATHAVTAVASLYGMTSVKEAVTAGSYPRWGHSLHTENRWTVLNTILLYLLVNADEW